MDGNDLLADGLLIKFEDVSANTLEENPNPALLGPRLRKPSQEERDQTTQYDITELDLLAAEDLEEVQKEPSRDAWVSSRKPVSAAVPQQRPEASIRSTTAPDSGSQAKVAAWTQGLSAADYGGDPFIVIRNVGGLPRPFYQREPKELSPKSREFWAQTKLQILKRTMARAIYELNGGREYLNPEGGRQAKRARKTLLEHHRKIDKLVREIKVLVPELVVSLVSEVKDLLQVIDNYADQAEQYITDSMSTSSWGDPPLPSYHSSASHRSHESFASSVKEQQHVQALAAGVDNRIQALKQQRMDSLNKEKTNLARQKREADEQLKALHRRKEAIESEFNTKRQVAMAMSLDAYDNGIAAGKGFGEIIRDVEDLTTREVNRTMLIAKNEPRSQSSPTNNSKDPNSVSLRCAHKNEAAVQLEPQVRLRDQHDELPLTGGQLYSRRTPFPLSVESEEIRQTPGLMQLSNLSQAGQEPLTQRSSTPKMGLDDMNRHVGFITNSDLANDSSGQRGGERLSSDVGITHDLKDLTKAMCGVMRRQKLPSQSIPVFSGDILTYVGWKAAFDLLIDSQDIEPAQKLLYMEQFLSGEALNSIKGCLTLQTPNSYHHARKVLEEAYGKPYVIARAFRQKAEQWPAIGTADVIKLRQYSHFLNEVTAAMNVEPRMPGMLFFDDAHYLAKMVAKLPQHMVNKWQDEAHKILKRTGQDPRMQDLARFVETRADIVSHPEFGNLKSLSSKRSSPSGTFFVSGQQPSLSGEGKCKPPSDGQAMRGEAQASSGDQDERNSGETKGNVRPNGQSNQKTDKSQPQQNSQGGQKSKRRFICYYCKEGHIVAHCPRLHELRKEERTKLFKDKSLCVVCGRLETKHNGVEKCHPKCLKCEEPHFTCFHGQDVEATVMMSTSSFAYASRNPCFARIMPVKVASVLDPTKIVTTLAFLDEGSDRSFVTEELVQQLRVNKYPTTVRSSTLFHESDITTSAVSGLRVGPWTENTWFDLPTVLSVDNIGLQRDVVPTRDEVESISALRSYAENFPTAREVKGLSVGLLIARDVPEMLKPQEVSESNEAYVVKSALGWGVIGADRPSLDFDGELHDANIDAFFAEIGPEEFLSRLEGSGFDETSSDKFSQEDQRFLSILENGIHINNEGHYEMPLPFKKDVPNVGVNTSVATRRLNALRRKFERDENYKTMYCTFMEALIENRDCEMVPQPELENYPRYYLPHHGVINEKKPGKVRVVFDCSARTNGSCLNDYLLQGPDLLNSLLGVLCRFRHHQVAFACDVERMFHMFHVIPQHRDYLRFLWWPQGDVTQPPREYRMRVHIFGATSSPGCATFGLRQIAKDHATEKPQASKFLEQDFYVDDGLASREDVSTAVSVLEGAVDMCSQAKLRLHKIVSNDADVLKSFPLSELSGDSVTKLTSESCVAKERTLGLVWDINQDRLLYHLTRDAGESTRRGMLATVAAVYDPLGLVAPYVLKGRLLLQEMCRDGLAWDDAIPEKLEREWVAWTKQIGELRALSIPRCFTPSTFGPSIEIQVHHFSDASNVGYGQCTYLRFTNAAGEMHCSLVRAKSRVVPIKKPTIPRLELQAAVLSIKSSQFVKTHLQVVPSAEFFWTDSEIVIAYLRNTGRRFHTFVAHRVNEILSNSTVKQWKYVATEHNPADHASRGLTVEGLHRSNWFTGPEFLQRPEVKCPTPESDFTLREDDVECYFVREKKESEAFGQDFVQRFSSFRGARRVVALLEMAAAAKHGRHLTRVEAQRLAECTLVRAAQREFLSDRDSKEPLRSLGAECDEHGVLRVKGRLSRSTDDMLRHPVILPRKAAITQLLVRDFHESCGHGGRVLTANALMQKGYHVIGQRGVCGEVVRQCVKCRRTQAVPLKQQMGDLPEVRLEGTVPFENVGVDCFGPFYVTQGRRSIKRYGLMCTCLSSRAVHLEVLDDMTTSSFINALRNLTALRGNVKRVYCDRGTNFVGASKEFRTAFNGLNSEEIERRLSEQSCEFHFSPAHASHMGGVWERQIRTARRVLQGLLKSGKEKLSASALRTLFYEAAAIINGRPYSATVVESGEACEPLTPNHLLTLKSAPILPPPGDFSEGTEFTRKQWCTVQRYVERFWVRWKAEYLAALQPRRKWSQPHRNLLPGDVVVIHEDDQPRNRWSLGVVESTKVSKDGLVRSVELRQPHPCDKKGVATRLMPTITRPIHKLSLLVATDQ